MTLQDIDRVVRVALTALLNGIRRWDGYFRENPPERIATREGIFERYETLSDSVQTPRAIL